MTSVPVVAYNDHAIYAIDLKQVADLLEIAPTRKPKLSATTLIERLSALVSRLAVIAPQIPERRLLVKFPGRDRSVLALLNHVLEVARSAVKLTADASFDESRANIVPSVLLNPQALSSQADDVAEHLTSIELDATQEIETYYGPQSILNVLDRVTSHVAQHMRQIYALLEEYDVELTPPLDAQVLAGLSLPQAILDD